jgi:hypothetical protein
MGAAKAGRPVLIVLPIARDATETLVLMALNVRVVIACIISVVRLHIIAEIVIVIRENLALVVRRIACVKNLTVLLALMIPSVQAVTAFIINADHLQPTAGMITVIPEKPVRFVLPIAALVKNPMVRPALTPPNVREAIA